MTSERAREYTATVRLRLTPDGTGRPMFKIVHPNGETISGVPYFDTWFTDLTEITPPVPTVQDTGGWMLFMDCDGEVWQWDEPRGSWMKLSNREVHESGDYLAETRGPLRGLRFIDDAEQDAAAPQEAPSPPTYLRLVAWVPARDVSPGDCVLVDGIAWQRVLEVSFLNGVDPISATRHEPVALPPTGLVVIRTAGGAVERYPAEPVKVWRRESQTAANRDG